MKNNNLSDKKISPEDWLKENCDLSDWNRLEEQLKDSLWTNNVVKYMQEYVKQYHREQSKGYPELFIKYCIDYVDNDDRDDLGYKYSILDDNGGDYKTFPDMDKVFEYWLNEIKSK